MPLIQQLQLYCHFWIGLFKSLKYHLNFKLLKKYLFLFSKFLNSPVNKHSKEARKLVTFFPSTEECH